MSVPPAAPVVIRSRVNWGDCDPAGVVYTPRFADYVVEASLAFLEKLFGVPPHEQHASLDLGLPAKAISIEFMNSLRPGQLLDVTVRVADVRTRTFDLDICGASVDGAAVFNAKLSLICIKAAVRESQPLPQLLRNSLIDYRDRCQRSPAPGT